MTTPRCFRAINLAELPSLVPSRSTALNSLQEKGCLNVKQWCQVHDKPLHLSDNLAEHLGLLLPLLLCGEQSAQWVFASESRRAEQGGYQQAAKQLALIGQEEYWHDQALTLVANQVPRHSEAQAAQQQAKSFYRQLVKGETLASHFVSISVLDTLVSQLMHQLGSYQWQANRAFGELCLAIAKDEAKHVYVSRHYAKLLGATSYDFHYYRHQVDANLGQLLLPYQQHFEAVGIKLDELLH